MSRTPMLRTRRHRRPSPALIVAMLALVLATTGSAIAGVGMVTGSNVRDGSLSGADIRAGSVRKADLAQDARPAAPVTRHATAMGAGPVTASCATGELATGGGGSSHGLWRNEPHTGAGGRATGWTVEGTLPARTNDIPAAGQPAVIEDVMTTAWVICIAR